jgi:hypothetical protein
MDLSLMSVGHIYLLQAAKFVKNDENVFKIGKTTQFLLKRFNQYPKGSILFFHMACENSLEMEQRIIRIFKKKFILHQGREYFKGDHNIMIDIIYRTIKKENKNSKDILKIENIKGNINTLIKINQNKNITKNLIEKDNTIKCNYVGEFIGLLLLIAGTISNK